MKNITDLGRPLAEYYDTRFSGRRTYYLYSDFLVVNGVNFFRSKYELNIPLSSMYPNYSKLSSRPSYFKASVLLIAVGGIGLMWKAAGSGIAYEDFGSILYSCLFGGGIIGCLMTMQNEHFIVFLSDSGKPLLDIAYQRKTIQNLDAFLEILVENIQKSKGKKGSQ